MSRVSTTAMRHVMLSLSKLPGKSRVKVTENLARLSNVDRECVAVLSSWGCAECGVGAVTVDPGFSSGSLLGGLLEMEHRVEPLAHNDTLLHLHLDLVSAKGLQHNESNGSVEGGGVEPAGEESLTHNRGEVALLDVEHVGGGEEGAGTVAELNGALRVVQSVDNCSVFLPIVVIHS